MSNCRITGLVTGFRYHAKNTSGVWRTLSADDTIATGENIEVFSSGPCYGVLVYRLQNRVSGVWTDAINVSLDLADGTSHTRTDKITVTGDATDSTVTVALTHAKGHKALLDAHRAQDHAEKTRGVAYTYEGQTLLGVVSEVSSERGATPGGYLEGADARLVTNRRQFAQLGLMPIPGRKVQIGGDRFFIGQSDATDTVYTFELRRNNNDA